MSELPPTPTKKTVSVPLVQLVGYQPSMLPPLRPASAEDLARQARSSRGYAFSGKSSKRPLPRRYGLPYPKPRRTYIKTMSTAHLDDERLGKGTKIYITKIHQLCGKSDSVHVTKAYLAKQLQCSKRQVQRYQKEAEMFGYVVKELAHDAIGMITGAVVTIAAIVRPWFSRENRENLGETQVSQPQVFFNKKKNKIRCQNRFDTAPAPI